MQSRWHTSKYPLVVYIVSPIFIVFTDLFLKLLNTCRAPAVLRTIMSCGTRTSSLLMHCSLLQTIYATRKISCFSYNFLDTALLESPFNWLFEFLFCSYARCTRSVSIGKYFWSCLTDPKHQIPWAHTFSILLLCKFSFFWSSLQFLLHIMLIWPHSVLGSTWRRILRIVDQWPAALLLGGVLLPEAHAVPEPKEMLLLGLCLLWRRMWKGSCFIAKLYMSSSKELYGQDSFVLSLVVFDWVRVSVVAFCLLLWQLLCFVPWCLIIFMSCCVNLNSWT